MTKKIPLPKKQSKMWLPFVMVFALIGAVAVIVSFAEKPYRSDPNDPWAGYITTDKLHTDPIALTSGQSFTITYDKLVSPNKTFRKAKAVNWDLLCYAEGEHAGYPHAYAYIASQDITNTSGRYSGMLVKSPEHGVTGEILDCFLTLNTYDNVEQLGRLAWDRIHLQASVAE